MAQRVGNYQYYAVYPRGSTSMLGVSHAINAMPGYATSMPRLSCNCTRTACHAHASRVTLVNPRATRSCLHVSRRRRSNTRAFPRAARVAAGTRASLTKVRLAAPHVVQHHKQQLLQNLRHFAHCMMQLYKDTWRTKHHIIRHCVYKPKLSQY